MKFINDKSTTNGRTHASKTGNVLLCTGDKPAHPLLWDEFMPGYFTLKKFKVDELACKKCLKKIAELGLAELSA